MRLAARLGTCAGVLMRGSPLAERARDHLELFHRVRVREHVAEIGVHLEPGVKILEQMRANRHGSELIVHTRKGKMLGRQLILHRHRVRDVGKERGKLEQGLGGHDAIGAGVVETPLDVVKVLDSAVCENRDEHLALDGSDCVPVGGTDLLLLLRARAAMHSEDRRTSGLDHAAEMQRGLKPRLEKPDLDRDRDLEPAHKRPHDRFDERSLFQKKRAVVPTPRNVLRAT
eukprot:Amastigsp_a339721_97.p3 type:complete len:229 gc:universal Amastigsp_a339721_97:478-1164(+)